jgi:hypothetical protein
MNQCVATVALAFGLIAIGCSAEVGDDTTEELATSQSELIVGNWAGPFTNGDAGGNPVSWTQSNGSSVVLCEVFEAGDGRYHPGKLWSGTCRYEYGGVIKYGGSYYTLQWPSSGTLQGVATPNNAVASSPSSLPVCGASGGTGKVWQGNCIYEYNGSKISTSSFSFIVKN